jgi:hypothetical protein
MTFPLEPLVCGMEEAPLILVLGDSLQARHTLTPAFLLVDD